MNNFLKAKKALFAAISRANNGVDVTKTFNVEPKQAQSMRKAAQESSDFLKKIKFETRVENAGQTVGISSGLSAARTDTSANKARQPRSIFGKSSQEYRLRKINFDTYVSYDELDNWVYAEPNYIKLLNEKISESKARSLLCIAFNGVKWSENSDFNANPLLQDCGIGWLQKMRQLRPEAVYGSAAEPITWGAGQEYKNLDAVVLDATEQFIKTEYLVDDLVVLCNRRLLGDKYFEVVNRSGAVASEMVSSDVVLSTRRVGNLPALGVPYCPDNTMLVTSLRNLKIYFQKFGVRRKVDDQAEYDRIVNFESENVDFIVEEPEAAVLIQEIKHIK